MKTMAALENFRLQLDQLSGDSAGDPRDGASPTDRLIRLYGTLSDSEQRQARMHLMEALVETPRVAAGAGRMYDLLLMLPDLRPASGQSLLAQLALDPSLATLSHGELDLQALAASLTPAYPFDLNFYEQLLNQAASGGSSLLTLATARSVLETSHSGLHTRALKMLLEQCPGKITVKQLSALLSYLDVHLATAAIWRWLSEERSRNPEAWEVFSAAWAEAVSLERSRAMGAHACLLHVETHVYCLPLDTAIQLLDDARHSLEDPSDANSSFKLLVDCRSLTLFEIDPFHATRIFGAPTEGYTLVYSKNDRERVVTLPSSSELFAGPVVVQ